MNLFLYGCFALLLIIFWKVIDMSKDIDFIKKHLVNEAASKNDVQEQASLVSMDTGHQLHKVQRSIDDIGFNLSRRDPN